MREIDRVWYVQSWDWGSGWPDPHGDQSEVLDLQPPAGGWGSQASAEAALARVCEKNQGFRYGCIEGSSGKLFLDREDLRGLV